MQNDMLRFEVSIIRPSQQDSLRIAVASRLPSKQITRPTERPASAAAQGAVRCKPLLGVALGGPASLAPYEHESEEDDATGARDEHRHHGTDLSGDGEYVRQAGLPEHPLAAELRGEGLAPRR